MTPPHPNRSKNRLVGASPTPDMVKALRAESGLSQTNFARISYSTLRACQSWESGDRNMHPLLWEFYLIYFGKLKPRYFEEEQ